MNEANKLNLQDYELCEKLKSMRLSGMAEELMQQLSDPNADLLPFNERIGKIVSAEWELLADCTWINDGRNLIITGATGTGKSWLSNALCVNALRQFKTVRYIRVNILMNELEQANVTDHYLEYINQMSRYDLLVIDDRLNAAGFG